MSYITDGRGRGYAAGVNSAGRLLTSSRSIPAGAFASLEGRYFAVNTDDITLTSDSESAVLFVNYRGESQLIIPQLNLTVGTSTGGDGSAPSFRTIENPTDISSSVFANIRNRNFSSVASSLVGDFRAGVEGDTFTGGEEFGIIRPSNIGLNSIDLNAAPIVLETGNTLGIAITPPTGNTSATYRVFVFAYEVTL
jgi:hypothetical protein